jgi:predicted ATPase/DNA-binding XRE family transcriptional regulator
MAHKERTYGEWVKLRRKGLGMTRTDLAMRVPCSVDMIHKIEMGLRRPSEKMATRIAICLNVPAEKQPAHAILSRIPKLSLKQALWLDHLLPPCNIYLPQTRLIGRQAELANIKKCLVQKDNHLLTLVGPPGVGKTRLALQAAYALREYFEDGVFIVSLAALHDPNLLMETIMQSLGVEGDRSKPAQDILSHQWRDQQMLILLDNFEQVFQAAPQIARLLERCSLLKILVTSRLALRIRPEHRMAVKPLAVPGETSNVSLAEIDAYSSVALFTERAQAVNSDFLITTDNLADVVGILKRLEGLPLAIELIAAHMAHLSPSEVYAQLTGSFLLHSDGWQNDDERQRSLSNALAWSFRLLSNPAQRLFACLGIFIGGWSRNAAKAICCDAETTAGQTTVQAEQLSNLTELHDHHLVEILSQEDGETRYLMLEPIRQYALSHLQQSGDFERMRLRHCTYFLGLVEAAQPHLIASVESLAWIEMEIGNLRAALRRALEMGWIENAARLMIALTFFWAIHSRYLGEGRQWLDQLFKADNFRGLSLTYLARLMDSAGTLAYLQGDYKQADCYHQRGLSLADSLADPHLRALALFGLSNAAMNLGKYQRVMELAVKCLPIARQVEDHWLTAMALNNLAEVTRQQGDLQSAEEMFSEGFALLSELNAKGFMAILLTGLGLLAQARKNYQQALSMHTQSIWLACEVDDRRVLARCLEKTAGVIGIMGQPNRAAQILGAADALRSQLNTPVEQVDFLDYEKILTFMRKTLGENQFRADWESGRKMTLDEAIALTPDATKLDVKD